MNRRELLQLAAVSGVAAIVTAGGAQSETRKATPVDEHSRTQPTKRAENAMRVQMLVYPGMTLLDLVGPLQVWAGWPGIEVQFVWKSVGPVRTDAAGLSVVATTSLADAWRSPDILFVPGGAAPTIELLDDASIIEFVKGRGEEAKWVTSVCSGALVLGAAGLLKGYRAATHWFVRDALPLFGAIPSKERWVIDRNRATGGGVTAGIDFGLAILAHLAGDEVARATQLQLEYSPQLPFRSGTPEEASAETLAAVKAGWASGEQGKNIQQRLQAASRRLHG